MGLVRAWGPCLALVVAGGCSATEPRSDGNAFAGAVRGPAPDALPRERWSIVTARANEPLAFMREGGVLALSLLDGVQIEISGASVTLFVQGQAQAPGNVLTSSDARSRVTFEHPGARLLEGELTADVDGKRQLSTSWATFTLERAVAGDPRVKLCASGGRPSSLVSTSSFTRRAACEAGEDEVLATGHAASGSLTGSVP